MNCTVPITVLSFFDTKRMSFDRSSSFVPCVSSVALASSLSFAASSFAWPSVSWALFASSSDWAAVSCCCAASAAAPVSADACCFCASSCCWPCVTCWRPESIVACCCVSWARPSVICCLPSTSFCRWSSSRFWVSNPLVAPLTPLSCSTSLRKSATPVFCASENAAPSFVVNTSVPVPPFALGNLSASSSWTWLVLVPGMVIDEEMVPANRAYVPPAMPINTIHVMITSQCRRAENRPRR